VDVFEALKAHRYPIGLKGEKARQMLLLLRNYGAELREKHPDNFVSFVWFGGPTRGHGSFKDLDYGVVGRGLTEEFLQEIHEGLAEKIKPLHLEPCLSYNAKNRYFDLNPEREFPFVDLDDAHLPFGLMVAPAKLREEAQREVVKFVLSLPDPEGMWARVRRNHDDFVMPDPDKPGNSSRFKGLEAERAWLEAGVTGARKRFELPPLPEMRRRFNL